jgi:acyl-CoA-binding protein
LLAKVRPLFYCPTLHFKIDCGDETNECIKKNGRSNFSLHWLGFHKTGDPTMSDLNATFEAAVKSSTTSITERPDNATLLKLYALYKQATEGDNESKKPSFTDMVARAKWDAWAKLEGTTPDEAKQIYIDLIESLK